MVYLELTLPKCIALRVEMGSLLTFLPYRKPDKYSNLPRSTSKHKDRNPKHFGGGGQKLHFSYSKQFFPDALRTLVDRYTNKLV